MGLDFLWNSTQQQEAKKNEKESSKNYDSLSFEEKKEFIRKEREKINNIYTDYINSEIAKIEKDNNKFSIKAKDFSFHFDGGNFFILDKFNSHLKIRSGKNSKNISDLLFNKTIKLNPNLYGLDFRNNPFGKFSDLFSNLSNILSINKYIKKVKINLTDINQDDLEDFLIKSKQILEDTGFNGWIIEISDEVNEEVLNTIKNNFSPDNIKILKEKKENPENRQVEKNNNISILEKLENYFEKTKKEFGIKEDIIKCELDTLGYLSIKKIKFFDVKSNNKSPNIIKEFQSFIIDNQINKLDLSFFCRKTKKGGRQLFNFIKHSLNVLNNSVENVSVILDLRDFSDDEIENLIENIKDTNINNLILAGDFDKQIKDRLEDELKNNGLSVIFEKDHKNKIQEIENIRLKKEQEEKSLEISKLLNGLKQVQEVKEKKIESFKDFEIAKSSDFATFEFALSLFKTRAESMNNKDKAEYVDYLKSVSKLPKKDRREFFIEEIKQAFTGIAVHKKMDLDAKGILFLSKIAGLNFKEFNYEIINSKGELESGVGSVNYLNNSKAFLNEDGNINEDILRDLPNSSLVADLSGMDGLNVFKTKGPRFSSEYFMNTLDHHSEDSLKGNCATRQMFAMLLKLGLIKDLDKIKKESPEEYEKLSEKEKFDFAFLKEMVRFITREDDKYYNLKNYNNSNFSMSPDLFNNSHKTLYGYIKLMEAPINLNIFEKIFKSDSIKNKYNKNNPRIPLEFIKLSDEELKEIGLLKFTDEEISLEYKNKFKEDLVFPNSLYDLEEEYWKKREELNKQGKKNEKTNTRLEWLMNNSKKISIYIKNRKIEEQFNKSKKYPANTKYINGIGKMFIQKDFHFFENPTDILICSGYDGYINYSNNGKNFMVSLFGDNYPKFDIEFEQKLKDNHIKRVRGMLIKDDKNFSINKDLFDEILNNLSLNDTGTNKVKENDNDILEQKYLSLSEEDIEFLNSLDRIKQEIDGTDELMGLRENLNEIFEFADNEITENFITRIVNDVLPKEAQYNDYINNYKNNYLLYSLIFEQYMPEKMVEIDNKKFYLSGIIKNDEENIIVCFVDDGKKIIPRLIKNSSHDGIYRAFPFVDTLNGSDIVEIGEHNISIKFKIDSNKATIIDDEILQVLESLPVASNDNKFAKDLTNKFCIRKDDNKMEPRLFGVYNFYDQTTIEKPKDFSEFRIFPANKIFFNKENTKYFIKYLEKNNEDLLNKIKSDNVVLENNFFKDEQKLHKETDEQYQQRIDLLNKCFYFMNISVGEYDTSRFVKFAFVEEMKEIKTIDINNLNTIILNSVGINKLSSPKEFIPNFSEKPEKSGIIKSTIFGEVLFNTFNSKIDGEDVEVQINTDRFGRVWIGNVNYKNSKITTYGTFNRVPDLGVLLMEPIIKGNNAIVDIINLFDLMTKMKGGSIKEFISAKTEILKNRLQVNKGSWDFIYTDLILDQLDIIKEYKKSQHYLEALNKLGSDDNFINYNIEGNMEDYTFFEEEGNLYKTLDVKMDLEDNSDDVLQFNDDGLCVDYVVINDEENLVDNY